MAPSHVAVMLEVCCPAKSSTISQPVTSESLKARPALVTLPVLGSTSSLYRKSMIFWRKSSETTWPERRAVMTREKMPTISLRAASRSRCLATGAEGHSVESGVSPPSSEW